jgi:hypothetical protein
VQIAYHRDPAFPAQCLHCIPDVNRIVLHFASTASAVLLGKLTSLHLLIGTQILGYKRLVGIDNQTAEASLLRIGRDDLAYTLV